MVVTFELKDDMGECDWLSKAIDQWLPLELFCFNMQVLHYERHRVKGNQVSFNYSADKANEAGNMCNFYNFFCCRIARVGP